MGKLTMTALGAVAAAPFDPTGTALVVAVGSGTALVTRSGWRRLVGNSDGPKTVRNLVSDH